MCDDAYAGIKGTVFSNIVRNKHVCVHTRVCMLLLVYSMQCQIAFADLEKQRLHGHEKSLAFSLKPICRPDNVAHMRRNHWLPVKAGSSNGVITVRDNAERCTFLSLPFSRLLNLCICSTTLPSTDHSAPFASMCSKES